MSSEEKVCVALNQLKAEAKDLKALKEAGQFVRDQAALFAPAATGDLQQRIFLECEETADGATATVFTSVEYAIYVEFGTGRKGAANHVGISPEVSPAYTLEPWWIHESQVAPEVPEKYHWPYIDTEQGRFYRCEGQPAQPFMYPALKENEDLVVDILRDGLDKAFGGITK